MRTRLNVPLAPLTTLRVGGPAARLVELEREEDVLEVVREADRRGEVLFVLGEGSNVVVGDDGVDGVVARMIMRGVHVTAEPDRVVVDVAAGESWDALVERAVDEGWRGVACISGVPGLVGATPIQNVGAYGQEVGETIVGVRAFDRRARSFVDLAPSACGFGYRSSAFKRDAGRYIVTRVRFAFERGDETVVRYAELSRALSVADGASAPSRRVREAVVVLRRAKGMILDAADPESVSAGSFFVNPVLDAAGLAAIEAGTEERVPRFDAGGGRFKVPAAWLVERAGFPKGWGTERAGVSRKHALALVNRGGATAQDLLAVARSIRDGVSRRFGVVLEPEPVFVGCSWEGSALT
jgi:UDP-N-acetylmuramate dehydrogenase